MSAVEHAPPPRGITRWLYATNHKDIGKMYLVFGILMFLVGGLLAELGSSRFPCNKIR